MLPLHLPLLATLLGAANVPAAPEPTAPLDTASPTSAAAAAAAAWSDFPGPPIFTPMTPLEYSRSALISPPLLMPKGSWAFSLQLNYASEILLFNNVPNSVLLDAEIAHLTFTGTFRVSPNLFLLVMGGVQGAYAGFLDGLLDAYHSLLGITYVARDLRPTNKFAYHFQSGQSRQDFKPVGLTLLDTRLGVGWMVNEQLQLLATVVVPTAWVDGYAAHTVQFGAMLTWQRPFLWSWLLFDGTVGLGATPRAGGGLLQPYQNVVFASASVGFKARLSQRNFIYANFFLQSPLYRNTGDWPLDFVDGSLDFGWMFRTDANWEFAVGLTENPVANGPAPDIVFCFGVRHGF